MNKEIELKFKQRKSLSRGSTLKITASGDVGYLSTPALINCKKRIIVYIFIPEIIENAQDLIKIILISNTCTVMINFGIKWNIYHIPAIWGFKVTDP